MKSFVAKDELPDLATKAEAHYAANPVEWPAHPGQRVFHIYEGTTGRNVRVQPDADTVTALLDRKPLRLRYSTTHEDKLLELAIPATNGADAARLASILIEDLGVPLQELRIVRQGAKRFTVVAGGLFAGMKPADAERVLGYLQSDAFRPPEGRPRTQMQRHFQLRLEGEFETLKAMPKERLLEHLRRMPLGLHAQQVAEFLPRPGALARLDACAPLLEHLRAKALRATFPPCDPKQVLANQLVPVTGSIWLPAGLVAKDVTPRWNP